MNDAEREREAMEQLRRIPVALELIAARLERPDPNTVLMARVATLEEVIRDVIATIENPQSTNSDWDDLLMTLKEAVA